LSVAFELQSCWQSRQHNFKAASGLAFRQQLFAPQHELRNFREGF